MAETSDTEQSESADDEPAGPPDRSQLDELGSRIDRARTTAEDAVEGVGDDEDEREFSDSGATEAEDDQTAAPPG